MIAHTPASATTGVAEMRVRVVVFTSPLTLPGPCALVKGEIKRTKPLTLRPRCFTLESRMTARAKKVSFAVIRAPFHPR
jgi:hypothetical protein